MLTMYSTLDDMVCRYSRLKQLQSAPRTNIEQLSNWNYNRPTAIKDNEIEFIHATDLVTVATTPKTCLRRFLEQQIVLKTNSLCGFLASKKRVEGASSWTRYGNDSRVDIIAQVFIMVTAIIMLVLPMWWLARMDGLYKKLGIITGFVSVFTTVLSSATFARPFEVLAATAGQILPIPILPVDHC